MRYIWVLGHTKSGKSTLAAKLRLQYPNASLYEAGAWARKLYEDKTGVAVTSKNDSDPVLRQDMTQYAMEALKQNPNISVEAFKQWAFSQATDTFIIVGIRNPYDFFSILSEAKEHQHLCQILTGEAQDSFEVGVDVIVEFLRTGYIPNSYQLFKSKLENVSIPQYTIFSGFQKDTL